MALLFSNLCISISNDAHEITSSNARYVSHFWPLLISDMLIQQNNNPGSRYVSRNPFGRYAMPSHATVTEENATNYYSNVKMSRTHFSIYLIITFVLLRCRFMRPLSTRMRPKMITQVPKCRRRIFIVPITTSDYNNAASLTWVHAQTCLPAMVSIASSLDR